MATKSVANVLVNKFKGMGFWRSETEGILRRSFHDLTDKGFSEEEAFEFLNTVWAAALGEYGE